VLKGENGPAFIADYLRNHYLTGILLLQISKKNVSEYFGI